ncbi:MAG: hypothetical protein MJZ52_03485 [Bacteroidales bacterium]|nr:hypothetical protein [Bacteroidales bacterium]
MDPTVNPILNQDPHQMSWAELKEYISAISVQMKETDRQIKETNRQMKETDRQMKETDRKMKETDRQMKATDRKIKALNDQFISQTGHILEGLTKRSALRALQKAGFRVKQSFKEMTGSNSELGLNMEIDLLYADTTEAVAVEVKTNCTKAKINHFLKQMRNFKLLYPRFADLDVYVAVAALNYTKEAEAYAREKGLIVIHVSDDVFTIDPIDREKLKRF